MTTEVALQATKRRKMGYDVDFFNDSGVPMDGIELDSSSSSTTADVTRGNASRSGPILPRPGTLSSTSNRTSNPCSDANNDIVTNSQHQNDSSSVGTTNQGTHSKLASSNDSTPSSAMPPISSTPSRHQQQQHSERPKNDDDLVSTEKHMDEPLMSMANNEAMTNDHSTLLTSANDDGDLKFSNHSSPDYCPSPNELRDAYDDSCQASEEPQQQSTTNGVVNHSNNEPRKNKEKATQIRSFGDLFDDDDLD